MHNSAGVLAAPNQALAIKVKQINPPNETILKITAGEFTFALWVDMLESGAK